MCASKISSLKPVPSYNGIYVIKNKANTNKLIFNHKVILRWGETWWNSMEQKKVLKGTELTNKPTKITTIKKINTGYSNSQNNSYTTVTKVLFLIFLTLNIIKFYSSN